jgi:hypothetical protein
MLGNPRKIEFKLKLSGKHVFRIKVLNVKGQKTRLCTYSTGTMGKG